MVPQIQATSFSQSYSGVVFLSVLTGIFPGARTVSGLMSCSQYYNMFPVLLVVSQAMSVLYKSVVLVTSKSRPLFHVYGVCVVSEMMST
jgi:hypothetical protein